MIKTMAINLINKYGRFIPLAMLAVLVLACFVSAYEIKSLEAENERLAFQAESLARENTQLKYEAAANLTALALRETERARLTAETAALQQQLEEVYKNDPDAETWAAADCPDGVLECLRR